MKMCVDIYRHIVKPFFNNIYLFGIVWILIVWPDIYNSLTLKPHHLEFNAVVAVSHIINLLLVSYLYTYILIYLYTYLNEFRKIYLVGLTFMILLHTIINIFCIITYRQIFDAEIIAIIKGTNRNEVIEYFNTFISIDIIIYIIIVILLTKGVFSFVLHRKHLTNNMIGIISLLFLFIGLFATIRRPNIFDEIFLGKYKALFLYEDGIPKLEEFLTNPTIIRNENIVPPKNIVMIIGESFSKSHSSLYNYSLETNPKLEQLRDLGLLFVFSSVESPATNTINSFKSIMSTYRTIYGDSIKYNECPTIIEMLQKVGYNTYWFSNQSKKGLHDNLIGRYADLCDYNYFVGNMFSGLNRHNFDEELIGLSRPYIQNSKQESYNFYVFHLMGSHSDFRRRYPDSFSKFTEEDYLSRPKHQRKIMTSYDNSIYYNDYVVYELMNIFKNKEAVVFYFPDHGLDCYDSDEDYIGHARLTVPKSVEAGIQIPFMIYLSPLYQKNFPSITSKIANSKLVDYNTGCIIYTIINMTGIELMDDSCKSLLNN